MNHSPKKTHLTRRDFLFSAVGGSLLLPSISSLAANAASANDKIQLGVIGIGPRCRYVLSGMLKASDMRCVAIADVQASRRKAGKELVDGYYQDKNCKLYRDFRELLDRKDIDAVLIATGDRWHAAASMLAARAGKDVYSEKPCGITIDACQRLAATMNQEKRVFQAGTQRRSVPNFQTAVTLARSGKLGKIHTMHASIYVPVLENTWLPAQPQPNPEDCDWNMWLGPAPWRPFNQKYVDGGWRRQWDFDSGCALLDWGAHTVDLCQWANDSDDTMPIEYEPSEVNIVCRYANGVKMVLDFLKQPFGDRSPDYLTRLGTCPVRFVGEEGWVETGDSGEIVVEPKTVKLPEQAERVQGLDVTAHSRNFFDAIRTRDKTRANPDVMRRSHITCHAAAIAWVLGRKLKLDPVSENFIGDSDANLLRTRPSRDWAV
ncbi:MAG: Gfo/Idh/MocA family oxidoreductase [Verrucomicrobiota bacterium]